MLVCASPLCAAQCARPADLACAFATSSAPKPPSPGPCGCHTSHAAAKPLRPARSPSLAHNLATRHHGPSCAASYLARCSARIAQPKPAQPARHPPGACGTRTRPLASAAPLPLRPRRSCATAAPLPRRHREFPCCLRTNKGAGLAWQRVSGELQRTWQSESQRQSTQRCRQEGNAHAWNGRPAAGA